MQCFHNSLSVIKLVYQVTRPENILITHGWVSFLLIRPVSLQCHAWSMCMRRGEHTLLLRFRSHRAHTMFLALQGTSRHCLRAAFL